MCRYQASRFPWEVILQRSVTTADWGRVIRKVSPSDGLWRLIKLYPGLFSFYLHFVYALRADENIVLYRASLRHSREVSNVPNIALFILVLRALIYAGFTKSRNVVCSTILWSGNFQFHFNFNKSLISNFLTACTCQLSNFFNKLITFYFINIKVLKTYHLLLHVLVFHIAAPTTASSRAFLVWISQIEGFFT